MKSVEEKRVVKDDKSFQAAWPWWSSNSTGLPFDFELVT